MLKNIENIALENIFELYSKEDKQVFIAIDKLSSYGDKSSKLIKNNMVLQLDKNKLLFIKNGKINSFIRRFINEASFFISKLD